MRNPPGAVSSHLSTSSRHAIFLSSSAITERHRRPDNASPSKDSGPSSRERFKAFPNNIANSGLDDELTSDDEMDTDSGYMWYGTQRREKRPSPPTAAHQAVLASTLLLLQAHILTGQGGLSCTPWPEENKAWLNNEMAAMWQSAAKRYRAKFGDKEGFLNKFPDRWEAREVFFQSI